MAQHSAAPQGAPTGGGSEGGLDALAGAGASAARKDVPACFAPILASMGKAVLG